jgi:hypothetical protein
MFVPEDGHDMIGFSIIWKYIKDSLKIPESGLKRMVLNGDENRISHAINILSECEHPEITEQLSTIMPQLKPIQQKISLLMNRLDENDNLI